MPPPPLASDMARVWFLRQADPAGGNIYASSPVVYVDRKPLTQSAQGTAFFHDFAPGRYRLSAQAFGTYSDQHDIVHLEAGTQTYVQIIPVANWELGLAGRRLELCRFADGTASGPGLSADLGRSRPKIKSLPG